MIELEAHQPVRSAGRVRSDILDDGDDMIVIIKRRGSRARQWLPYARHCARTQPSVLLPDQSLRSTLFAAAGRNGWDLAEPGVYTVQVAIGAWGKANRLQCANAQSPSAARSRGGGARPGRLQ